MGGGEHGGVATPGALVQFTQLTEASLNYTLEKSAFSAAAISPGTKDLALGRANGHIEVLDDVFENAARYLDQVGRNPDTTSEESSALHPEQATVRRTVHWHAHPVRALAFVTTPGGAESRHFARPATLLSGGEESVLVTWELDRHSHKPSHFVARVGRGAIVDILYCPDGGGKAIAFCADSSIQCFHGATHERLWAAQGLAAAAPRGDGGGDARPIVMARDPITRHLVLTNLPGAPGPCRGRARATRVAAPPRPHPDTPRCSPLVRLAPSQAWCTGTIPTRRRWSARSR